MRTGRHADQHDDDSTWLSWLVGGVLIAIGFAAFALSIRNFIRAGRHDRQQRRHGSAHGPHQDFSPAATPLTHL